MANGKPGAFWAAGAILCLGAGASPAGGGEGGFCHCGGAILIFFELMSD